LVVLLVVLDLLAVVFDLLEVVLELALLVVLAPAFGVAFEVGRDVAVRPPLAALRGGRSSSDSEGAVGTADVRDATVQP